MKTAKAITITVLTLTLVLLVSNQLINDFSFTI